MASKLESNYEIVFNQGVSGYKTGDIVVGSRVAGDAKGIDYLLSVGAIKESSSAEKITNNSSAVQDLIDAAVAQAKQGQQDTLDGLSVQIDGLQGQVDALTKQLADSQVTVAQLNATVATTEAEKASLNQQVLNLQADLSVEKATNEDLTTQLAAATATKGK